MYMYIYIYISPNQNAKDLKDPGAVLVMSGRSRNRGVFCCSKELKGKLAPMADSAGTLRCPRSAAWKRVE